MRSGSYTLQMQCEQYWRETGAERSERDDDAPGFFEEDTPRSKISYMCSSSAHVLRSESANVRDDPTLPLNFYQNVMDFLWLAAHQPTRFHWNLSVVAVETCQ